MSTKAALVHKPSIIRNRSLQTNADDAGRISIDPAGMADIIIKGRHRQMARREETMRTRDNNPACPVMREATPSLGVRADIIIVDVIVPFVP